MMFNSNELKAEIARNGYTQGQVAEMLGMSANTFSAKMKKGKFGLDEADRMIDILGINRPVHIFFGRE